MNTPVDQKIREQALNTQYSFIVQAPAGSGKTELLTQRYLALLSQAKYPEEILAITFTRKAAGEMRDRVINALQKAKENQTATQQLSKTWELANKVLLRDQQQAWQLLENPARLRIQTIDALCNSITQQMPILSRLGAQPSIADNSNELYLLAAREIIGSLENDTPWVKALTTLLLHLDNNYDKVEKLLSAMLAQRDQWLPYIAGINDTVKLRQVLENSLKEAINETLLNLTRYFPTYLQTEICALAQFAATQLIKNNVDSSITLWHTQTSFPAPKAEQLPLWQGLIDLLLTKSQQWRKQVSQNEGFPAQNSGNNPAEKCLFSEMKNRMKLLLEQLAENDILLQYCLDLRALPPAQYTDQQWEILTALLELLPVLVAHLKLIFQAYGVVDYSEIAQNAIGALGDMQNPSDLALTLDYRIQHILVDEFQDTSIAQFRLLEQLTAGWQPNDGHTLFLVGDPMQSIYRFRKAEVGLFLQARIRGIGSIKLTPLTLSVNFRSQPIIVEWINQTFQKLMPATENISIGAVTYSPSSTIPSPQSNEDVASVNVYPCFNPTEEAQTITTIIQNTYAKNPTAKIAVLVRARTHLLSILPQLKQAGIPYRALEIEPLAERPYIQDIFALTRALLHLGDRIAWLAILRAPWCGIKLADLHAIANNAQNTTIWQRLQDLNKLKISEDAKQRLTKFTHLIKHSLQQKLRLPLDQWVERTWLNLGGPACLRQHSDLEDIKAYCKLLAKLQHNHFLPDAHELSKQLNNLYAISPTSAGNAVEIMTIHKAKGLEFDCVILPSLQRAAASDEAQLLLALERATAFGHPDLLLAPIKSASEDYDPIYSYLYHENKKRETNEIIRLLYVAATRAKFSLHLLAVVESNEQNPSIISSPPKNSLLAHLWPAVGGEFLMKVKEKSIFTTVPNVSINSTTTSATFKRIVSDWVFPELND